jgi:hypothetical protein
LKGGLLGDEIKTEDVAAKTNIVVLTSFGSSFLDKRKKFNIPVTTSIADLKEMIEQKFPGSPPFPLQRLFFAGRLLEDSETVENITADSPSPVILLDMMTGTAGYHKNLTISQAIEAYVSCVTQQTYIGEKLKALLASEWPDASVIESYKYQEIFQAINASVYENCSDFIRLALEKEKNPEVVSSDISKWNNLNSQINPLIIAFVKQFDLTPNEIRRYLFFTFILLVRKYSTVFPFFS